MYVLLTNKENHLPTVVNQNSTDYCDFIMCGNYIEEDTGSKREMEEQAETIIQELYCK